MTELQTPQAFERLKAAIAALPPRTHKLIRLNAPGKWIVIDLETGERAAFLSGYHDRASAKAAVAYLVAHECKGA